MTKEQAIQSAMNVIPELQNKIVYKVTDEKPLMGLNIYSDCWYIIYSSLDKHCAGQNMKSKLIAISKTTGEVLFNG
jgi:hypothetical protein